MTRKISIFTLLILIAGIIGLQFYTPTCGTGMRQSWNIFIETAVDREMQAVLDEAQTHGTCTYEGITYVSITYADTYAIVFRSGAGPEAARKATEATFRNFSVRLLVQAGSSGGLDPALSIGETTVAAHWLMIDPDYPAIAIDRRLIEIARQDDTITITELGITSDHFVQNYAEADSLWLVRNASTVDMETYAVAAVAVQYDVPYIAFRSVSDFADGGRDAEYFALAERNSALAALRFISAYDAP